MKKVVIAPDSFKGSLTSRQVIGIVSSAAARFFPGAEIIGIPVADGGEGTVDALCDDFTYADVSGPLGEPVRAKYGRIGSAAVLEMSAASGLPLVPQNLRDPRETTSYGTGQLILAALDQGLRDIVIGIGGSATNDGGAGALRALGVKFSDADGAALSGRGGELGRMRAIDPSGLDPRLRECSIRVMCDVTNPLTGARGATAVYGPQKGATPQITDELEAGMKNYETLMRRVFKIDTALPGAGAAGGLGAALMALGGALARGIDAVLDLKNFDRHLDGCDMAVTGEGCFDAQSLGFGKAVSGVLARAEARGVPVAVLAGCVAGGADAADGLLRRNASVIACVDRPMPVSEALETAAVNLRAAALRMFAFLKIGGRIPA